MAPAASYSVILDRDQTINADPGYLNDPAKVALLPLAADGIRLLGQFGVRVFIATNQAGVAKGLIQPEQLEAVNARLLQLLKAEGAYIEKIYVCPHGDADNCDCRKPKPGLIRRIIDEQKISPAKTFIAGDRARDLECALPFKIRGILVGDEEKQTPENLVFRAANLHEAASFILEVIFEEAVHSKVFASGDEFLPALDKLRGGKTVVFTNGCFDLLHSGHVQLLAQARALGDYLILGLNSDRSVRRLKGESRPVNNQNDRARILAQLPYIDAVVVFDEDTPVELMQKLKPDIQVKGGDYIKEKLPEYEVMKKMGKDIVILPFRKGYSTTGIIKKLNH